MISSIVRGWKFGTVLEAIANLTLHRLIQFCKTHYIKKNAYDLCNTMKNMLQLPEESVYLFVMRCLDFRQKTLRVSEKLCCLGYSPGFINKLFLRTVELGFSNPFVVHETKPFLRSESVCDEELLAAIVKASAFGKEVSTLQDAQTVGIKKKLSLSSIRILYPS